MRPNQLIRKSGLALWMDRVLEACDLASATFDPEAVHDLRVALRRSRSVADGLMAIDPDPAWKQMKKAGRTLFRSLGALRDVHVMQEWVRGLGAADDPVTVVVLQHLSTSEISLKQEAARTLADFDRKQWRKWSDTLPRRAARFRAGSVVFKHLALERWMHAHDLHSIALRNRSKVAFHNLRIGLKKFRYIVENFLPEQHSAWSEDLKHLQDLLGEVHDLDVLWARASAINAFPNVESQARWRALIGEERARRIATYRGKMLGRNSLWPVWRAALPQGKEIRSIALARLKHWASVLDPDFSHSNHVARLALNLYDGLNTSKEVLDSTLLEQRTILRLAALLHGVGHSKSQKKADKSTYKRIENLTPPLGIGALELHVIAIVARHHQGPLPHPRRRSLLNLSAQQRRIVLRLTGILRLARAFGDQSGHIEGLTVDNRKELIVITADGYTAWGKQAEDVARARHLLEIIYKRPIVVKRGR